MEKQKVGTKQRAGNKVTDRVRMKVKFCPRIFHFHVLRVCSPFPVPRSLFSILLTSQLPVLNEFFEWKHDSTRSPTSS